MRKKVAQKKSTTLRLAGVFILLVVLLISFSLCVKLWLLFSKSTFDGNHQFILGITHDQKVDGVIVFDPTTPHIEIIALKASSAVDLDTFVPRDADTLGAIGSGKEDDIVHTALVSAKGINVLDKIRLLLFSQTVPKAQVQMTSVSLPIDSISENSLKNILTDEALYKEAVSIAVVNASGVAGLGNTIAAKLETIGANVISVTTADQESKTSSLVTTDSNSYTLKRLEHLFSISPKIITAQQLATITLILGSDAKVKLKNI